MLLWSTGFIAAKLGLPDAPALKFLAVRFALVAVLMTVVALASGARFPARRETLHSVLSAWMVHALYLGGVFVAIGGGMPAGTAAMMVGLQPIVTVLIAHFWLDENVVARQWVGLVLGLAGVAMVVHDKIGWGADGSGFLPIFVALASISVGTLYQKRHCARVDLRSGAAIQFTACALVYLPLAWAVESDAIRWTPSFLFALAWSALVLSVGAISLLFVLLRHGAAANVATLFYLVPPVTAIQAWLLFGEKLDLWAYAGMIAIAAGVALARAPQAAGR